MPARTHLYFLRNISSLLVGPLLTKESTSIVAVATVMTESELRHGVLVTMSDCQHTDAHVHVDSSLRNVCSKNMDIRRSSDDSLLDHPRHETHLLVFRPDVIKKNAPGLKDAC